MAAAPTMLHPDLLGPYDPYGMLRDGGRLDIDTRCKRLLYRCRHRGAQEIDLILATFAERFVGGFSTAQFNRFEARSTAPTPTCSIGSPAAARHRRHMRLLRCFCSQKKG
jgi:antitoxin CptB